MLQMETLTLEQQAQAWIKEREELCQWRSNLIAQGGPVLSLKPDSITPDNLPQPLQSEVVRLLKASGDWY